MSLYPENLLPETEEHAIAEIQMIFDTLNNALSKSVELSGMLDSYLSNIESQFTIRLSQLDSNEHPAFNIDHYVQDNGEVNKHNESATSLTDLSKLGENILKVAEYFGELPPQLKKLKSALGIFTETSETVSKATELFTGEAIGATVAGDIVTGGEIAAGAVGVAEAASAFGPPGWVVAVGALATAAVVSSMSERERTKTKESTEVNKAIGYWLVEREHDRLKLSELYDAKDDISVAKVNSELDKDYMKADRLKRVGLLNEGKSLVNYHPNSPSQKIAVAHKQPKFYMMPLNINGSYDHFTSIIAKVDDLQQNRHKTSAELYDDRHPITVANTDNRESVGNIKRETQARMDLGLPLANAKSAFKQAKKMDVHQNPVNLGRVININLNRPMIEHFTVNATGVKEGLNDFKYKVEEILLEILNSANVIR